ncbi:tetratricopeptide repeat protein [uncultured Pluralibacter sp.]|uniref:NfrA family protein n=1 Tax=uncultured Pluralibacter sp. TaxID=1490864 RepID=UPI0026328510|nr:tetratricopeptide repeat protein [uncultured Pluralibacter sp.]
MNRNATFRTAPRALSLLVVSLLSSGALAQTTLDTSAKGLGLSDYRHFVIYPHLERAMRAQKSNDEKTALAEFRHAHEQAPDNVPLALFLAEAYRHFGHNNQAREVLAGQLKRNPNDPRLQQQLDAIPTLSTPVTTVEALLALQKKCDAAPNARCRSETGQYALKFNRLDIARAQLADADFARTAQGKALENGILQRAIYLKEWTTADALFSQRQQRRALSAAERQQWFDVLLAGHLDARVIALQSAGTFTSARRQLEYAGSLASRNQTAELQRYLAGHRPRFDTREQEQSWLYLISRYSQNAPAALAAYAPRFAENRRYAAGAALPAAMRAGDYDRARRLLNALPDNELLAERYALSAATGDRQQTLRFARQLYQRAPQDMARLDTLSWQLMQNGRGQEAASLLLGRYPFTGAPAQQQALIIRLAGLLKQYPQLASRAQLARLDSPLASPALREAQSQLPGGENSCGHTRRLLGDLSARYGAAAWSTLAECYSADLPGMALYAQQQAAQRQPGVWQQRAVAYRAYAVEDYSAALRAWKALPSNEMSNEDLMAAANTAQAAGDAAARDRWTDDAKRRGLNNSEAWWWLHAQRYLPEQPNRAIADLNRAIAIEPTPRALSTRAALYRTQGHTAKAIADLRQALLIDPDNGDTEAALGYALWSNKEYVASRSALEKALHKAPDDPQIIRQLMYVNERLGNIPHTQQYAENVIDELDADASVAPLTPAQKQEHFDVGRLHEDMGRRWSFNLNTSIGLSSGRTSSSTAQPGGSSPGQSYRSFGQMEAEYRLGRNVLVNGDILSVYSRVFADTGGSSVAMPVKNPILGPGLRWKPLYDYTFFLAIEQEIPLDHHHGRRNTMLRASASFLNNGKYSDDWHPNGNGWFAQNLYLDAAQYLRDDTQAWTADYRASWHQKVANAQTVEPYAHVQLNGNRDRHTEGNQLGGVGVRWNIWTGQTQYDAWPHKLSVGLEYQRTFKAINQDAGKKNNLFLTLGVHW